MPGAFRDKVFGGVDCEVPQLPLPMGPPRFKPVDGDNLVGPVQQPLRAGHCIIFEAGGGGVVEVNGPGEAYSVPLPTAVWVRVTVPKGYQEKAARDGLAREIQVSANTVVQGYWTNNKPLRDIPQPRPAGPSHEEAPAPRKASGSR